MTAKNKLLMIEESVLLAMANNPTILNEFGFLKSLNQLRKTRKTCGKCNKAANKRIQIINAAKQSLVNMGVEKKRRLKTLLNAEKVRIRVAGGGKVTEHTF